MKLEIKEEFKTNTGSWDAASSEARSVHESAIALEPEVQFIDNRIKREWLSTEEAAYFLSISTNALRIMVHRNQIHAFKVGRRLRFRVQDCRRLFLKKGE